MLSAPRHDLIDQDRLGGIAKHPQVSTVGLTDSRAEFIAASQGNEFLSASLWQRPDLAPRYQDVFNNVSGIRDILRRPTWDNLMYARLAPDGSGKILYRYSEEAGNALIDLENSDLAAFFDAAPEIKCDVEFGVRSLLANAHTDIVIQVLNEYPHSRAGKTQHVTHLFHSDQKNTFYIQVGGAGLEFTNAIPDYQLRSTFEPEFGEDDPTTIRIADQHSERMVSRHEIATLNAGDFMHFRGYRSGIPLVHRAPCDRAVAETGRLAFSIYPT